MATGWGNKTWGASEWGDLADETVVVSSIVATSSIGSSTTEADANVTASSLLATSSPGQVTQDISLNLPVTGIEATSSTGQAVSEIGIEQSGISTTSSIGTVSIDENFLVGAGWGREVWGSFVWGDNYSVLANGIGLTATIGNEDAFTDVTVAVSGQELQSAITAVGTSANSDNEIAHSFLLTGSLGSFVITGDALIELSGMSATVSIGSVEAAPKQEVDVTGIQLTANLGNSCLLYTSDAADE